MTSKEKTPEGEESIKVQDKRRFDEEGNPKNAHLDTSSQSQFTPEFKDEETTASASEINFSTFIFSLGSAALVELGAAPNPASGKHQKNLSAAKQHIDLLSLIKEKTKNNLSRDEEKLLDNFLYDLRIRYVESLKQGDKS